MDVGMIAQGHVMDMHVHVFTESQRVVITVVVVVCTSLVHHRYCVGTLFAAGVLRILGVSVMVIIMVMVMAIVIVMVIIIVATSAVPIIIGIRSRIRISNQHGTKP